MTKTITITDTDTPGDPIVPNVICDEGDIIIWIPLKGYQIETILARKPATFDPIPSGDSDIKEGPWAAVVAENAWDISDKFNNLYYTITLNNSVKRKRNSVIKTPHITINPPFRGEKKYKQKKKNSKSN